MKVYLAGPDVFLADAAAIGKRKKELCARFGLVGLFPLDSEMTEEGGKSLSLRIFRGNTAMMEEADAIIANLTPFRGPSADPGTIYELGFMAGQRKICFGYSNVSGTYLDKVLAHNPVQKDAQRARYVDKEGAAVEDFELPDNLMIVHALEEFGHPLVMPNSPLIDPSHDLGAFEICVRLLAERRARLTTTAHRHAL